MSPPTVVAPWRPLARSSRDPTTRHETVYAVITPPRRWGVPQATMNLPGPETTPRTPSGRPGTAENNSRVSFNENSYRLSHTVRAVSNMRFEETSQKAHYKNTSFPSKLQSKGNYYLYPSTTQPIYRSFAGIDRTTPPHYHVPSSLVGQTTGAVHGPSPAEVELVILTL